MTHSAIEFKCEKLYLVVKDRDQLQFLVALGSHLEAWTSQGHDALWLAQAIIFWLDEYHAMPPGVRDMELDPWLTTPDRLALFRKYLRFLAQTPAVGNYDEAAAQAVARRLLVGLDGKDVAA